MSNSTAHEMSPAQARVAGRYAAIPEERGSLLPPPVRELDPAVAGLVAWLPTAGGKLSQAAIDRWTEAARTVLTLAHASEEEKRG